MLILSVAAAFAAGCLLMTSVGIRVLIDLFSSIPLARRKHQKCPDFDLTLAFRRIGRSVVFCALLVVVLLTLVMRFAPSRITVGFLSGMILGFLIKCGRISPNNTKNQREFLHAFEDCYVVSCPTVTCSPNSRSSSELR